QRLEGIEVGGQACNGPPLRRRELRIARGGKPAKPRTALRDQGEGAARLLQHLLGMLEEPFRLCPLALHLERQQQKDELPDYGNGEENRAFREQIELHGTALPRGADLGRWRASNHHESTMFTR